ncbi:MAG: protein kinase [Chloroflexi bacterium]|nr:protein kinase [Chloroflexota bacterium]
MGRYKLESLLGRGAMAEVYKSTHPDLGRDIAVKILHPFHTQIPGFIGRFRLEAQAVASLHHPNIVQVYDFAVTDDGLYYMVMQYINGLSLEEYLSLEKSPLPLTKTFWFFRQIANGLQFAHQRETIHRDVKPANIMLDTRENAFLSDFGLAKIVGVERQTLSGMSPGTPSYMAPEHLAGKEVTAAADIYAMGVILYRMLTNRLPFEGDNLMTVITRTLTEPPTPPSEFNPDIPPDVEAIVLKAMSENPEERFADTVSMSRALARAIAKTGGVIPPESTVTPVGVVPLPGLQLDNYKVKREFVRDSVGVSRRYFQRYLAHNVALDNMAVLTVLQMFADEDSNFINRFQQRMHTLSLLDHPGLAAITRVDKTPSNQPYVAYEFIPGDSLETKLAESKKVENSQSPSEALHFMRQVAETLAVVHAADIIHNDLRPENIVVRENGEPVLVGLEIPVAPDANARGDAVKTLDYASPEQLEGSEVDRRSNVYSLGVVLYEMLTGHRPILDWETLDENHLPQATPLTTAKDSLAPETYQLAEDCLQRQADGRLPDMDAFIQQVDQALVAELALSERSDWMERRRRRLFMVVPAILLGIIFIAFAFFGERVASSLTETATPTATITQEATAVPTTPPPTFTPTHIPSPMLVETTASDAAIIDASPTSTLTPSATATPSATSTPSQTPTITPTPPCEKPEDWVIYIVKEGEALFNLALASGSTVEEVIQVNCLSDNILSIGQELWLPIMPATTTPTITNTLPPTSRPRPPRETPTKTPPPPPDASSDS